MFTHSLLKKLLSHSRLKKKTDHTNDGFTLTELLVSIIIGGLIVTSVTGIMTDILRASKEEEVRTNTQKDMERALQFIASELQNATYVYTGDEIRNARGNVPALNNFLDVNANYNIVLAFWKPEVIPYTPGGAKVPVDCTDDDVSDDLTEQECVNLQTERRTYTLVVYVQDTNPSDTWEGESIIRRYQLRKFETDQNDIFTDNNEDYLKLIISESNNEKIYVDPVKEAERFSRWPHDVDSNLQDGMPVIDWYNSPALVDFVDDPTNDPGSLPTCLDEDANNNGQLDSGEDSNGNGVLDVYSRTPAANQSTSFFACVRQAGFQGDFSQGNQDVIVYLRGNPDGRSGVQLDEDSFTPLPTLQTQVMLRGVRDKFIND